MKIEGFMEKIIEHDVLLTFIICITIIGLSIVALYAYKVYKNQRHTWGGYIYHASILLVIAISVFSFYFHNNRNVLDFISLASALISIILAVITIIYSFYSNSQTSGVVETLNKSAESIKDATSSYNESAKILQNNIDKIVSTINRVEEKTDLILDMTSKTMLTTNGQNQNNFQNFNLDEYIKAYVNTASPLGLLAMYGCIKSSDNGKDWNLNVFPEDTHLYCVGFLIATTCSGLIQVKIDFKSDTIHTISYIPSVDKHVMSAIENTDFANLEALGNTKDELDRFFNNNESNEKKD